MMGARVTAGRWRRVVTLGQLVWPLLLGLLLGRLLFGGSGSGGERWSPERRLGGGAAAASRVPPSSSAPWSYAEWRAAKDEQPIHIFHSICAHGVAHHDLDWHGLTVIKTILMARETGASRNRRYHFHIASDTAMRRLLTNPLRTDFADVMEYLVNRTGGRVAVTWYDIDVDIMAPTVASVGSASAALVDNSLFKQCSTIRLKVPFIRGPLARVDRLLYIDFDSIVKCDLEVMWEEQLGDDWEEGQVMSMSQEGPHPMYPTSYSVRAGDPTA